MNEIFELAIKVKSRKVRQICGLPSCIGEIRIGDFVETFIMPLDSWSIEDYEQQWREGLERIKRGDSSCLVATVQNIKHVPLINWWLLYKNKNMIVIYNQLLTNEIFKTLKLQVGELEQFSMQTCYAYIEPKKIFMKNAHKASRWEISCTDAYS